MAEEDLIFGKNRHFYGGIEPSNMTKFEVTPGNQGIIIDAQLPADTVVNGQTLCSVAGAIIRRKMKDYPKDEFDGDKIVDISMSGIFTDSTADPTGTYYYAAFPYTTQGVYAISPVNRAVVNEPDPMVVFEAETAYADDNSVVVNITAQLPDTVVGAVIRKSTRGYPVNENDGEEFMTITENGVYTDTNVVYGNTYFYAAFPYTSTGDYNRSESNRTSVFATPTPIVKGTYIYGFDLDTTDPDPSTRVTYPKDVDNYGYTPVCMGDAFNYGSWTLSPGQHFMPKPCVVNAGASGAIEYLDPNNYAYLEDGTTESSVAKSYYNGYVNNAMMEWPKIYTHRELVDGVYKFRCSDVPQSDDWDCWCNYDRYNNEIDHFYTAIYPSIRLDSFARSLSGDMATTDFGFEEEITRAVKNGSGWYVEVVADRLLIQDLLVMMARTTDCQTAYGKGRGSVTGSLKNGTLDANGLFFGNAARVKVFGMEDFWGGTASRVAGLINDDGVIKVKITRGTHDGTTVGDYNVSGEGYLTITDRIPYAANEYISKTQVEKFGRFPITGGTGSSSTYECDAIYLMYYAVYIAVFGGTYEDTSTLNGPFRVSFAGEYNNTYAGVGSRLSFKPSAN